jgi:6-phosphogluconolactonase
MEFFLENREAASVVAAAKIISTLQQQLAAKRSASLVVSGGTSPGRCFEELAKQDIGWDRITVLASDERWVPPDHDDSNEKLIRDTLLVGHAKRASFVPYFDADTSIGDRCTELDTHIRKGPFPFTCSLLGMGADGHFASLFPDADNLDTGLDKDSHSLCLPVRTEASPYERVSLTLSALSRSHEIILLFFGADKRAVYEAARDGDNNYPVSALLRQKRAPVHVYWAP